MIPAQVQCSGIVCRGEPRWSGAAAQRWIKFPGRRALQNAGIRQMTGYQYVRLLPSIRRKSLRSNQLNGLAEIAIKNVFVVVELELRASVVHGRRITLITPPCRTGRP